MVKLIEFVTGRNFKSESDIIARKKANNIDVEIVGRGTLYVQHDSLKKSSVFKKNIKQAADYNKTTNGE